MFIIQLSVIVFACYVVGKLMEQIGQTQVIGHIAAGVLLGPTFFPGIMSLFSFQTSLFREGANKQVISSQADSLIKISRIWADFFPAN
ncbi:hypothetical protein KKZ80_23525, partial [Enterobacter kobei]|uniref:hypothetical protein n=1 Tax=Enterobacter kobei TaxID=208224 RepID=UPI001DDC1064|nr:hypothetical protein [Enterobacter kobei]